ncbi:broad-complex core protein isoforms 1/2/3/4/5-like, partial [Agrilus planipennis]
MESEQFSLSWNNFHSNLSAGFHSLLQDEDLVDVTLAAEGQYLKAHKTILSVCSPYFKELFRVNPCKHPIVILQDVNYSALKNLLQFMYYGEVSVSQEEIPIFMRVAETLKVKGLTDTGSNGFLERMTTEHIETRPAERHHKPSKKIIKHVQSRSTESPHSSYSSHPSESPRLVKSPEPTPVKRKFTEESSSEVINKAMLNPKEEPVEQNEEYTDLSYDDSLDMSSMLNTSITESPHPSGSWMPPNQTQSMTDTSSP